MVIGIIGASFSGLIAGSRLAKAGHDVTIIERNRSVGGRLASVELDDMILDYGVSHFSAQTSTFRAFLEELSQKEEVREWAEEFSMFDGDQFHVEDPNASPLTKYALTNGMRAIAKYLSRWVDIKSQEKAGGLTYIGPDRSKKRSWMINLTDINVFECDAVLIAAPAPEAYGVLQTAQDETAARKIIRVIDEVYYDDCISLAATYNREAPNWKGIECERSALKWIGNESSKRGIRDQTGLALHSSHPFARENERKDDEEVTRQLLEEASTITGSWVLQPASTYLHRWKFFRARNPIDEYFMELEMIDAPLALIGNYFGGQSLENAFLSGYNLAEYWINKYSDVTVT
ncbi:NAD(P)/FAD-dependent oxidoreductase [Fodinibius sediminis]|uniref:Predicted NAD/FAD-dependent oxidoreductase n=1 Tax=Fodinibius sediminis TaxID=1214077 RepID=A0A521E5V9_9BACT|nr:FAD-dependent oxidoreductase [Fodinibius sediminis]SMO78550.1 Predicted NAD/FAD-dependent oxidoreductase [Fodinibius sediminis]